MAAISIIIVNYNVKYFLEQCLCSILAASQAEDVEVIVVDNASTDNSVPYIRDRFPDVIILALERNLGFSTANNRGVEKANGEILLFLNPDTLVPETIISESKSFLSAYPDSGAVGFRMLDGSGRFLKESKRGIPTIWASFCKFSGISLIFPSKKAFSGYYLGNFPETEICPIEIISGAAFLMKKAIFLEIGGFDERFFMYGEDIDLSLRIKKAGYTNYYCPKVTLLHFKGESSPKTREYYRHFYGSMGIFLKKYMKNTPKWPFYAPIFYFLPIISECVWLLRRIFGAISSKSNFSSGNDGFSRILNPGESVSYESVITEIYKNGPSMISAKGSGSMVGSPDRKKQGMAIALEAF